MSLVSIGAKIKPQEVKFLIPIFNRLLITRFVQLEPNMKRELFMKLDEDFVIDLLFSSLNLNNLSNSEFRSLLRILKKILPRLTPRQKFRVTSRLHKQPSH